MIDFLKKIYLRLKNSEEIDYDFLKSVDIFSNLSDGEIDKLDEIFLVRHYKKNEIIFRENYPHVVLYIIKSGKVKIYLNLRHEKVTIHDLGSKKHFGEIGFFVETNRIASAIATEDTELIAIKHTDMKQFIKDNPATGIKLLFNLGKSITNDFIEVSKKVKEYET